ncbi:hypothetical protein COCON_G00125820 [Conger conger]|uniref:Uncharacterized protein n=1 Tax=Conger conger TaxID=82655 RepID=A0A9Q1DDR6_CONCO|nr:uncharacterized protein C6orf47 homolog [Conger conger]XP_061111433.1 uncharacterized protein C6orf47 homolog [Conger conger]KAJ8267410.1 hypothetical protein COCON_G00125820 [Conger conger]
MTAVAGRVWGWVRPAFSYRPWGGKPDPDYEEPLKGGWGWPGVTTWIWGGWKRQSDPMEAAVQYWETEESIENIEAKDLGAARTAAEDTTDSAPRWWSRVLPSTFVFWPRAADSQGPTQRPGGAQGGWDSDKDGAESDYGTPPPSPTPPSSLPHPASPFRLFAGSWKGEVLPEHYEICFNFVRHLFDLLVVGFLWAVSVPVRAVLEVAGLQGALKLWVHGMVLFLVSTTGMAGILWLIQEYLPQFALIYGIVQALVISVSVHQSISLGEGEGEGEGGGEEVEVEEKDGEEEEDERNAREEEEPEEASAEGSKGKSTA